MKTIVLIACCSKKKAHKTRAQDLYISPLFQKSFAYASALHPDHILILSAQHGLVHLDQELAPYNTTLNTLSTVEKKVWAQKVLAQLATVADLQNDAFVFLAGANYRKHLIPHMTNHSVPMQHLGIGKQLHYLKEHLQP